MVAALQELKGTILQYRYDTDRVWVQPWGPNGLRVRAMRNALTPLDQDWALSQPVKPTPEAKITIKDQEIILWACFGLTHNPRVEDFPIMPCESLMVSLRPVDFFTRNPAMDVPVSNQATNASTLFKAVENSQSTCCS